MTSHQKITKGNHDIPVVSLVRPFRPCPRPLLSNCFVSAWGFMAGMSFQCPTIRRYFMEISAIWGPQTL
jgi:hypothetical protein